MEQAWSLLSGNQTSVCFSKEMFASLTVRHFSRPDSVRKARSCVGAQPPLSEAKCFPNQAGMTGCIKLPFLNLGEACASVFWKRAIDCYTGHAVSRMSELLEVGFGFTHALEGGRVAGLHVDRSDFPRVITHRVPESAMAMLHTSLLDAREEAGWGWLPAVLSFCHNTGRVVFAEGSVSELGGCLIRRRSL